MADVNPDDVKAAERDAKSLKERLRATFAEIARLASETPRG